ncbi:MAG: hypothetical protein IPP71_01000 [Bacteroidetes bacterium]|nr:hypothetical protein [Bacteroidota bacterium]
MIENNTFKAMQSPVGVFDCNFGGYARLSDNYIEETTWEYERTHDVNGNLVSVGDPDAMIVNEPNSFSYNPGVTVASGSPQPPEVHFEYTAAAGYVSGLTLTAPAIPYINLGDDIEIACSHGSLGSQNVSMLFALTQAMAQRAQSPNLLTIIMMTHRL